MVYKALQKASLQLKMIHKLIKPVGKSDPPPSIVSVLLGGSNQWSAIINGFKLSGFCRAYCTTVIDDCAECLSVGGQSGHPRLLQHESILGFPSIPMAFSQVTEYNGLSRHKQPARLVDVHTHFSPRPSVA